MFALKNQVSEQALREAFERFNESSGKLEQRYAALAAETEKLRAELKAKDEEVRRHERLALLGETAAALAHEVRNPLGSIKLFLSLLKEDCSDRPEAMDSIKNIDRSMTLLENVVSNILHFSKTERLNKFPVNLHSIILEQLHSCVCKETAKLIVETDFQGESFLLANEHSLRQVFSNLIMNAMQALKYSGEITISTKNVDEGISITVGDNGPGIPKEIRDRLFDPFVTTKNEGTGLGLAIVRQIISQHGGDISVESNQGAKFTIWLPRS